MRHLSLAVSALLMIACPAFGSSSFLGAFSGSIFTPDGVILAPEVWEVSYHQSVDLLDSTDLTAWGIAYGPGENLEIGVSFVDNSSSETAFNAKYRLLPETPTRPTILVGVFDVGGTAEFLDNDPGLYLLLSKDITPTATGIAGQPSRPLRLTVGAGTGIFDGAFASLDWALQPQLSLMVEAFGGEIGSKNNFFNVGIRYAAADALRLDAAVIDLEELGFGLNYRRAL